MTQTEQNSAVRTRDEQLASYPETVCVGQYPGKSWVLEIDADDLDPDQLVEGPVLYVRCDIAHRGQKEAEARGAAEQRRKDAELLRDDLAALVEGMSVSIDVSTGDHDAGNRLFGTVDETQHQSGDKNGLTLLVTSPEPNFKPTNVTALEARIAELQAENDHQRTQILEFRNDDRRIRLAAERVCSMREGSEIFEARIALRAALTREGGV